MRSVVTAAAAAGLFATSLAWFVLSDRTGSSDIGAVGVTAQLETVRQGLSRDFAGTAVALPPQVVRRSTSTPQGDIEGSLALPSADGRCFGFTVTVARSWIVDGDRAGLRLGPVLPVPAAWCDPEQVPIGSAE